MRLRFHLSRPLSEASQRSRNDLCRSSSIRSRSSACTAFTDRDLGPVLEHKAPEECHTKRVPLTLYQRHRGRTKSGEEYQCKSSVLMPKDGKGYSIYTCPNVSHVKLSVQLWYQVSKYCSQSKCPCAVQYPALCNCCSASWLQPLSPS